MRLLRRGVVALRLGLRRPLTDHQVIRIPKKGRLFTTSLMLAGYAASTSSVASCLDKRSDSELTDEAVELVTQQVMDMVVFPFIPSAFQEFFVSRLVRMIITQCGADISRRICEFVETAEDSFDAAGLEGLVDEIVLQIAPQVDLPLLSDEQKKECLRAVVKCVVAYEAPGATAMLLGAEAADMSTATLRSSIHASAILLEGSQREEVVKAVEERLPVLPMVEKEMQHRAIQWAVGAVGNVMQAVIPAQVAQVLVSFNDDELTLFKEHLKQITLQRQTPLDLVLDADTKALIVSTALDAAFSVLFDAADDDTAAAKKYAALQASEEETSRKLRLLKLTSQRKERRLQEQLRVTRQRSAELLQLHPSVAPGATESSWAWWMRSSTQGGR